MYSSAVFNDQFEAYSEPEIRRKPVDDLLLQLKAMHIDKVVNFPFPTNPGDEQLKTAERRLCLLGALKPNLLNEPGKILIIFRKAFTIQELIFLKVMVISIFLIQILTRRKSLILAEL